MLVQMVSSPTAAIRLATLAVFSPAHPLVPRAQAADDDLVTE